MTLTRLFAWRLTCLILSFAIHLTSMHAGEVTTPSPNAPIAFSYLTINEGLPSNTIGSLLQDKYGFIWIGTHKGLVKYDGNRVKRIGGTRSLSVSSMCERNDTIWLGTGNGLFFYCQESDTIGHFEINQKSMNFSSIDIMDITKDNDGNLWIATMGQGIIRIDKSGAKQVPTPDNETNYGRLAVDHKGNVWATTNWAKNTLILYDKKKKRFVPYALNIPGRPFFQSTALVCGEDKHMWMACSNGAIIRFNPATHEAQILLEPQESPIRLAHSITEIRKGVFLIGSDAGLTRYDYKSRSATHFTRLSAGHSPISDNFVYPILKDHEGGAWIGTYYGGVNYTHPSNEQFLQFSHSETANSVSGNVINNFCEDKYKRVWIASDDGGLTLYNPKKNLFIPIDLAGKNEDNHNVHALCSKGDHMLVGTYSKGINVVNINTLKVTNIPAIKDKDGNVIEISSYAMLLDRDSCLWVGTFSSICTFDPSSNAFKMEKKTNSTVNRIIQSRDGTMWFSTEDNGILSFNKRTKKWTNHKLADNPEHKDRFCTVHEDKKGRIWAGGANALYLYDKKSKKFSPVDVGVSPISIFGITDYNEDLWLTTDAGLRRLSHSSNDVEQVYKGGGNLTSTDFVSNAIFRASNNDIYIGTTDGFTRFSPERMYPRSTQPHIVFTSIDVNSQPVRVGSDILPKSLNHTEEVRLSYMENAFRVHFSDMSYIMPADTEYELYLEGFEKDWVYVGNQHSVSYTNLKPGTYVLHVRCTNNDGTTSKESKLKIIITPPFYWNTYSQFLYILILCILAYYLVKRYSKQIKRRHAAEIESLTTQKQQEIQQINSQKEQEIQQINSQKEKEIKAINMKKEIEVHDARIKFMSITFKDQEFLDNVDKIMEKNYSNPDFTIEEMASLLGISRTGLFTKLKTLADVTPNEMLQIIRLKHAADLLSQKQYRVSEVCYMVGFSSPSYFAKCFQKQYGVTPAKYDK